MIEFIMKIIDSGELKLSWSSWTPINDKQYAVYNVLIPELLVHLVQQDMRCDRVEAIKVIGDSLEYGNLGKSKLSG